MAMSPFDINEKLERLYGYEKLTGKVKYRVVRSEIQTEKRTGNYNVFTESGIFLKNETGTREVMKYWNIPPCWILERVEANQSRQDIFAEKWTYEPLFPFLDAQNNNLDLEWRPIEFMLNQLEKIESRKLKSESDFLAEDEAQMKKEEEQAMAILDAPDPIIELPSFKTSSLLNDTRKYLKKPVYAGV